MSSRLHTLEISSHHSRQNHTELGNLRISLSSPTKKLFGVVDNLNATCQPSWIAMLSGTAWVLSTQILSSATPLAAKPMSPKSTPVILNTISIQAFPRLRLTKGAQRENSGRQLLRRPILSIQCAAGCSWSHKSNPRHKVRRIPCGARSDLLHPQPNPWFCVIIPSYYDIKK